MAQYKIQHYTPKCYLSQFVDKSSKWYPKTKAVWIYDKIMNSPAKLKGIDNVCSGQYFYSHLDSTGKYDHEVEKWFGSHETKLGDLLGRIQGNNPDQISNQLNNSFDCSIIYDFALIQLLRGPEWLRKLSPSLGVEYDPAISAIMPEEWKSIIFKAMFIEQRESYLTLQNLIKSKMISIHIIEDSVRSRFNTSDNPIMITNPVFRNAVANPLTEISFPLTPRVASSLWV